MRVLQVGMTANHGGVESFVLNYAGALQKTDIHFDYVDLYGNGLAESDWILFGGSKIHVLQDYRRHPFLTVKKLKAIVTNGDYACVHINMLSAASLSAVTGALLSGAKVLVHSHNTQTLGLHRKILHGMHTAILKHLPVTRLACGKMAGDWMFGQRGYEVIPNAVDTDLYRFCPESRQRLRARLGIGEDTFVLGFAGRLSPQKNPVYLVRILDAVRKRGVKNSMLLIVGDGELRQEVQKAAAELGIPEQVVCVGSQRNINEWYSVMDVFVLPSLWEGLPLVGVEAQAAGLPCFLSDRITEELALTELAYFCELTETADNWAEKILQCRTSCRDRQGYADCIAQTKYSIARSAGRLREIYHAVASAGEVKAE